MSVNSDNQQFKRDRTVAFQIVQFLQSFKEKNESCGADIESACQSIESAFGISSISVDDFQELSYYPVGLSELMEAGVAELGASTCGQNQQDILSNNKFQSFLGTVTERGYFKGTEPGSVEYLQRLSKVIAKFKAKYHGAGEPPSKGASAAAAPSGTADSAAREKLAEEKKAAGNAAVGKKDYEEAVQLYSEAISFSPGGANSHIYYGNRAAAYCHLNRYELAAADCEAAIALNSSYVKAYSRLGLSRFFLGQYSAAVNAYQRAVDLEPGNKSHLDSLKQAQQKAKEEIEKKKAPTTTAAAAAPNPMGGGGGVPDLSALAGMMGGGGGGAGGLAGLMQNPAMMQMAQQMMQDPSMMAQAQQMMQDPTMMAQAQQMMQDPSMMAGLMGGGAGGTPGGNSPIPGFSGFAEEPDSPSSN